MAYEILAEIGKGILIGAGASVIGYIKSIPDGESFDYIKAVPAVVVGAVTGAVAYAQGISLDSAEPLIATFGVTVIVNHLWTLALKWYKNKKEFGAFNKVIIRIPYPITDAPAPKTPTKK